MWSSSVSDVTICKEMILKNGITQTHARNQETYFFLLMEVFTPGFFV